MESSFNFVHVRDSESKVFTTREGKEIFLQWGLENTLKMNRFKIEGNLKNSENKKLLVEFFSDQNDQQILGLEGSLDYPVEIESQELRTSIRSMEFFDRLATEGIVGPSGSIQGCFDETFDGITVSDRLKEMLVNPDSESVTLFSSEEKNELIYYLFKILCVGGAMSQPDSTITRYLEFTKLLYKELLILYKASSNPGEIKSACQVFKINSISGLALFPSTANPAHSHLIVVINYLEKYIVTLQLNYTSFWS